MHASMEMFEFRLKFYGSCLRAESQHWFTQWLGAERQAIS